MPLPNSIDTLNIEENSFVLDKDTKISYLGCFISGFQCDEKITIRKGTKFTARGFLWSGCIAIYPDCYKKIDAEVEKSIEEKYPEQSEWYEETLFYITKKQLQKLPITFTSGSLETLLGIIEVNSIEGGKFYMPFDEELSIDYFDDYDDYPEKDEIKTFVVNKKFDYDLNVDNHFKELPNLERFYVVGPSPFSVTDGVLYLDDCTELRGYNLLFDFFEMPKGRVLVAFPPNHPCKKFTIPSDVVAICNSAFSYSKIEEITIPDSVEQIGFCAFKSMKNLKKLRVPNKMIRMRTDNYDDRPSDFDLLPNKEGEQLNDEVLWLWNEIRHNLPHYDWSKATTHYEKEQVHFPASYHTPRIQLCKTNCQKTGGTKKSKSYGQG